MGTEAEKGEHEIRVMQEFAEIARDQLASHGGAINPDLITKREQREPDLLCGRDNGEYVAFELVRNADQDLAKFLDKIKKADDPNQSQYIRGADPTSQIAKKKFSKQYDTDYPIELLIYFEGRTITPDDVAILNLKESTDWEDSQFDRVWYFGEEGGYLIWERSID